MILYWQWYNIISRKIRQLSFNQTMQTVIKICFWLQVWHYWIPHVRRIVLESQNMSTQKTQDGKTVLDAHFATFIRFFYIFMKTWWKDNKVTRINTSNGLGFTLARKEGMHNEMVQVAQTNHEHLNKIYEGIENLFKTLWKHTSLMSIHWTIFGSLKLI